MSKIQAISDGNNGYIYPVTIPAAIIDPTTGQQAQLGGGTTTAAYTGPFAVSVNGTQLSVAGGRMYLGGNESTVAASSLASGNGTVYYYVYYNNGAYQSGCSLAATANALAAVIRGSQGYYTALAGVTNGAVVQYHYGDIVIDGRIS